MILNSGITVRDLGLAFFGTSADRRALAPLRNGLGINAQLPAQLRERSLRSLYSCSNSVRGRGAAVTNLSHRASIHSEERNTPPN